eukprot:TRINITY_DN1774_c0_g1_i3.p1 TRINITY_DN1774_c0_g1~~TRINITY_DN1774_c0_g1_i3.p1  ORF type:complete len:330 (-),score=79.41 TRINITY_DN1774_c0_g1_i3:460-1395(-)
MSSSSSSSPPSASSPSPAISGGSEAFPVTAAHTPAGKRDGFYRILTIDGGGVRGVVPSTMLKKICEVRPDFLKEVDMVSGTSIGGILALGLADGRTPTECVNLFKDRAKDIFPERSWYNNWFYQLRDLFAVKYDNAGLQKVVRDLFGEKTLDQIGDPTETNQGMAFVVPAYVFAATSSRSRVKDAVTYLFHNFGSAPFNPVIKNLAWHVAMYTSAAPTYFPEFHGFMDGGVYANDPSMLAVTTALNAGIPLESIRVLSLGTGEYVSNVAPKEGGGKLSWVSSLVDLFMQANAQAVAKYTVNVLGERYDNRI